MTVRAHVFVVLVTLAAVAFILRLVRRGQLRAKYAILWLATGALLVVLAGFPPLLDRVAGWVGVDYGPAVLFLAAIVFLLVLVVHFSWELSRLEERTRALAEELALITVDRTVPAARAREAGEAAAAAASGPRSDPPATGTASAVDDWPGPRDHSNRRATRQ